MNRILLTALLLLASSAWAGPYEDGLAAAINKDYATAIRLWQPLAQMTAKQYPDQLKIFQQAIDSIGKQDYVGALFLLQSLAAKGSIVSDPKIKQGVKPQQDDPKTAKAYQDAMAAAKKKDYATALTIWAPLAQAGHSLSQYALAVIHRDGYGVLKDDVRALMWFNISLTQIPESAKDIDTISKRITPQQMAEAQKLARECQARDFKGC